MKKLPKTFRGAEVVRGLGMKPDKLVELVDKKALEGFDKHELWLVIAADALEDPDASFEVKGFASKDDAVRFARAWSEGNVDHRVLHVTDQVFVVATDNEL